VTLDRSGAQLSVVVADNGVGLPEEFSLERPTSLGLSIVSSLVTTQLGGTIGMRSEGGTIVELTVPLHVIDEDLENL
jgi:two-component sensor histidine kinase